MTNDNLEYTQISIRDSIMNSTGGSKAPSRTAIIKAVVRESAQGRHLVRSQYNGKPLEQNRARSAAYHFAPNVSASRRAINSGFWELIDNPFKVKNASESELPSTWVQRGIWDKQRISIQEYLEIKYGHEPGFLTSEAPNIKKRKGAVQTYLQSFTYELGDQAVVLDLDVEKDEIMYLLALKARKIANSHRDVNNAVHSHYISKVNEGEVEKASRTEKYENAVARVVDIKNNYDGETVKKFAIVLGLIKDDDIAVNAVKNRVSEFINDEKYKYDNIAQFNEIYELFTGNENDKYKFETTYLLEVLLQKRIITASKGKHVWGNAPEQSVETLGLSREFTINFLMNPDMKDWRKTLCTELKSKTGIILK